MIYTLNATNPSSGAAPAEFVHYGSTTYGSTTYTITALYQSQYLTPNTIQYILSGKVYFSYRYEAASGTWSTWSAPSSMSNILKSTAGQWQYRLLFTGDWDSGNYAEVI